MAINVVEQVVDIFILLWKHVNKAKKMSLIKGLNVWDEKLIWLKEIIFENITIQL